MRRIYLEKNWEFRQACKESEWQKAHVPGNVHLDLIANNIIPDPYYRLNEQEQQWIGEADWEYRAEFDISSDIINSKHIDIVFGGLDTYADVFFNGTLVLQADNMYSGWRIDVKKYLSAGKNQLRVYFHSVIKKTLPLFEQNGFEYGANNSQPEPKLSVYSRKPGYHYGWDWGPRLLTCGVWRSVFIEAWESVRLDDVQFVQKSLTDDLAQLQLEVEIISSEDTIIEMNLQNIQNAFPPIIKKHEVKPGRNKAVIDFEISKPRLWWCNRLGEPYLYQLDLELVCENLNAGSWDERIGLRTIELVHEEDEHGKCFYFKLNGDPVFIKGANCLPVDYFIPRVQREDYKVLLKNTVDANMNMLRLWGGAIYEGKVFYDLCDEMGIMVWQDFMFACAMYPADEVMKRRIRQEAEYNIKRLRNHASLALWCGNNEVDEGWHTWGWQEQYNYSVETSEKIWNYYCTIFHEILPDAVNRFDPGRTYWSSSPKFGFVDPRSRKDGDMHYWGVWFLNHPREKFNEYLPKFMSEYGLQSMPELKTFKQFSKLEDWDLQSDVMKAHQRQYPNLKKGQKLGGYEMLIKYLQNDYHVPKDFELLAYTSQILQADYLRYAIETHRRNMPYCMGTMYWQLNDLWPVTSWSTIDYYGRWKAAHYAVQQSYQPVLVSTSDECDSIKVFVVNDLLQEKSAELMIQLMDFEGKALFETKLGIKIPPNSSKSYFETDKGILLKGKNSGSLVWTARLVEGKERIAENIFFFNYTNRLELEEPEIKYSIEKDDDEYQIKLQSKKLAKNVFIRIPDAEGMLSDNYFNLLPGSEKNVIFKPKSEWNGSLSLLHYFLVIQNSAKTS